MIANADDHLIASSHVFPLVSDGFWTKQHGSSAAFCPAVRLNHWVDQGKPGHQWVEPPFTSLQFSGHHEFPGKAAWFKHWDHVETMWGPC